MIMRRERLREVRDLSQNRDEMRELLCRVMPNLANQMRGPLGNIYGSLQRLLDQAPAGSDSEKRDRDLAMLYQSYYRMLRLMGNLSDAPMLLSERPLQLANEDIVALAHNICLRAEKPVEQCGQRLFFESDKPFHIIALHADSVERLLLNLLSNAMKFSGKGAFIKVSVKVNHNVVELSVEDSGPGLSDEAKQILFDRYQYPDLLDPAPQGFGLGLPLCRRIAQGHGGTILISSVPHSGTKVTVSFPNQRTENTQVRTAVFDYAGGFNRTLVELSDALPSEAFRAEYRDQ